MSIRDDAERRAPPTYSAYDGDSLVVMQTVRGSVLFKQHGIGRSGAIGTWLAQAETADIVVPVGQPGAPRVPQAARGIAGPALVA